MYWSDLITWTELIFPNFSKPATAYQVEIVLAHLKKKGSKDNFVLRNIIWLYYDVISHKNNKMKLLSKYPSLVLLASGQKYYNVFPLIRGCAT